MDNHISMMYIHVFAACFGLTVACCLPKPLPNEAEDKQQTATSPSLFAMLGEDKVARVGSDLGWARGSKRALEENLSPFPTFSGCLKPLGNDPFLQVVSDEFTSLNSPLGNFSSLISKGEERLITSQFK